MGDAKRKLSATKKFIEEFPTCFFCGGKRPATTREHCPQNHCLIIRIDPTNWLCPRVRNAILARAPLI